MGHSIEAIVGNNTQVGNNTALLTTPRLVKKPGLVITLALVTTPGLVTMGSVFHVILNGMYNYNSYIVGWHSIRPGQGGLSLTILPPVVHPPKNKNKRKKK